MKEIKVKKLSLVILTIILISCISTLSFASQVVDLTSSSSTTNNQNAGSTGNTGNAQTITPIDQPTFTDVNETVYATSNVSIHSDYTESSSVLTTLTKDQSITRTGTSTNGWSRVKMSNGSIGYVQSAYLTTKAPTVTAPITNNNTNSSIYTNTNTNTLPQTGVGDSTGMFIIIGICVISAIYAYKKVREYNV